MQKTLLFGLAAILMAVQSPPVMAYPWADPGDMQLRRDLQLLNDKGLINIPMTTWPLSWVNINRVVSHVDTDVATAAHVDSALARIERKMRVALQQNKVHGDVGLSFYNDPLLIRTFETVPREEYEARVTGEWTNGIVAARLRVTAVSTPEDDYSDLWLDGSYLGVSLGNWSLSLNSQDRWWGPGWDGSLILGTNARPIPGVTLSRINTMAPDISWLSWVGPWTFTTTFGQMIDDRAIPDVQFFAARFTMKPIESLELGFSRTAQWGGEGRPETWNVFWDMIFGHDNAPQNVSPEGEPGNQLAGYDLRWKIPSQAIPVALYAQMIGEDEAGGLPTGFMSLYGIDYWGRTKWGAYRMHLEYANTAMHKDGSAQYNTVYNGLYPSGYRYYDRSVGHSMDNDGIMWSLGIEFTPSNISSWNLLFITAELNRDGTGDKNTVSPNMAQDLYQVSLSNQYQLDRQVFHWGVGWQSLTEVLTGDRDEHASVFVQWQLQI
ncbi:MAG: capsule assembly Wzi family protein [Proteobacteria bacterium]|jgi:hypothetical protein|nr:capsule assembly Wzi family protein [Pseudomonadota bacterium]